MKKSIFLLFMVFVTISICACTEQISKEDEATTAASISESMATERTESGKDVAFGESCESVATDNSSNNTVHTESETSSSSEEFDGVSFDENGNVILSNPPTYAEILALHMQDPETYRDPGELQPECMEMIQLEDGQWYQSFVYASYNCRCIIWNDEEADKYGWWASAIGSAENAFLFNVGAIYDDPGEQMLYVERAIAVRGKLAEGPDGYAYQLLLPDMLIVCVENSDGTCDLPATETLAIPEAYAPLIADKMGEVIVTGVVMQDKNGVFYLKDVEMFA